MIVRDQRRRTAQYSAFGFYNLNESGLHIT